jgi:hypothetical protein
MIVFVTEIRDWFNNFRRRTLLPMAAVMAFTLIISMGRPETSLSIFLIFILFLGYISGRESWNKIFLREWIYRIGLRSCSVVLAKLLGAVCIGIIHIIVLLPLWIYINLMWGFGWQRIVIILMQFILVLTISVLLTMIGDILASDRNNVFDERDPIIGRFFIGSWLVITAVILQPYNPFIQIYNMRFRLDPIEIGAGLLFNLIFILLLIMLLSILLIKSYYLFDDSYSPEIHRYRNNLEAK